MLATAIIMFRECFEITIILSIVLAATRTVPGRGHWVSLGFAGGVLGAVLVAIFARVIAQAMEGSGQQLFNIGIMVAAIVMMGWTVIWMQAHGRQLSQQLKIAGHSLTAGEMELYALAILVCLSVWREGAEIVLFLYGVIGGGEDSAADMLTGGAIGAIIAGVVGILLYLGLIKLSMRHLFAATSALLTLLACGMSANVAARLSVSGMAPSIVPQMWDSSAILSSGSLMGKVMRSLLGYTDHPSGLQVLFYVATFAIIVGLARLQKRPKAA